MQKRSSMRPWAWACFHDPPRHGARGRRENYASNACGFHGTIASFRLSNGRGRGQAGYGSSDPFRGPPSCGDSVVNIGILARKSQWGNARWRWRIALSIRRFSMRRNEVVARTTVGCTRTCTVFRWLIDNDASRGRQIFANGIRSWMNIDPATAVTSARNSTDCSTEPFRGVGGIGPIGLHALETLLFELSLLGGLY